MIRGVDIIWAGGEHSFMLSIGHLRALQTKCDAGPMHIVQRLSQGSWFVDDVIEPIRLGLEGGGMPKEDARALVARFVEDDLLGSVLTARAVMLAALMGPEDDQPGENQAGAEATSQTRSRAESGASPNSTAGAPSSRKTSGRSRSGSSPASSTASSERTGSKSRSRQ